MTQTTKTGMQATQAVQRLRAARDEALRELAQVTEEECRYPVQWGGMQRTMNFLLRAFAIHEIDHLQHVQRLLRARGYELSEAQLILTKAQALRGELEGLILGLSDADFQATGPNDGDWSVAQLVDHLIEVDRRNLDSARKALAEGPSPKGA